MRTAILSGALFVVLTSSGAAQGWKTLPSPTDETITGICAVPPDTVLIVTAKGTFARTYDGGKSWQAFTVAAGSQLEAVSFADSRIGLTCGRAGAVFSTSDGGRTWQDHSPDDTLPWFSDVEMLDARIGLVIGLSRDSASPFGGLAYRTADGGASWEKQTPLGVGYAELFYRSGGPVYLLSFGRLHRSDDKGKSWSTIPTVEGGSARTLSIFGKTGILAGPNGMFAFSADTGKTWTGVTGRSDQLFVAAELVSEAEGYAGGMGAVMVRTTDGGRTWDRELLARSFNILDLCLAGNRLYAVGSGGVIIYKLIE